MMESDEEGVVTLNVSNLEEIEFDDYADTSEEETNIDDLAIDEVISEDDSDTLTASSGSSSSDGEASQSAGASSAQAERWVSVQGDAGPPPVPFTGASGLKHPPKSDAVPTEYFRMYFTSDIIDKMVMETNRYAEQWIHEKAKYLSEKPRSLVHLWIKQGKTEPGEFMAFLAVIMNMGLIRKPILRSYWDCSNPSQSTPWFNAHLGRERFELLLKFIHFNDNTKMPPKEDPAYQLYKIQPLIDHFQKVFKDNYVPERKISIDESMIGFRGKTPNLRHYMPNKHHARFGLKVWCLCEAESGYTVTFEVYKGKKHLPVSEEGVTYDLVMRLLAKADVFYRGYHLGLDNYFSSPKLFEDLWQKHTTATGTVRTNRKGLPDEAVRAKLGQHQIS